MATHEMIDVITKLKSLGYYNEGLNEAKDAICKHCGCHFDRPDKDCDCAHDGADPSDDCWVTPEAYKNMNEGKKKMVKDPKTGKMVPDYAIDGKGKDDLKKEDVKEAITITADSPDDLPALQRIMKLAGMEPVGQDMMPQSDAPHMSMKSDGDINANDDCGCEDETPEGFANSMGKEKDQEKYSVDSLEKQYGKTEIKKLPRKFSMRGDNPLEDVEEALRQEYITFVNESADVKKKTDPSELTEEEQLNELAPVAWALWSLTLLGLGMTVKEGYDLYKSAGNDLGIFLTDVPVIGIGREPSAVCKAFMDEKNTYKPGWCRLAADAGQGPQAAHIQELNNFYISLGLLVGGGALIKWGPKVVPFLNAAGKKAQFWKKTADAGKEVAKQAADDGVVKAIQASNATQQQVLQQLKIANAGVTAAHKGLKGADLAIDIHTNGKLLVQNLKTGEKLFLDPANKTAMNLIKRIKSKNDVDGVWNALSKLKDPKVSPGGIIIP